MASKLAELTLLAAAAFGITFSACTAVGYFKAPSKQSQARLILRQAVAVGVVNGRCTILVELSDGRVLSYDPAAGSQAPISLDGSANIIRRLHIGHILDRDHHTVPWTGSDSGAWNKYVDVLDLFNPAAKGAAGMIASTLGTMTGLKLGNYLATRVNQDSSEFATLLNSAEEWRHLERDVWLLLALHARYRPIQSIWDIEDLYLLKLPEKENFDPTPEQFCRFVDLVLKEQEYRSDIFNEDLDDILNQIEALDPSR